MFFEGAIDARKYCQMESIRTHRKHKVVKCKKYLCPPTQYFGRDCINGFTVILLRSKEEEKI
jgi:hypothetical protein